jgi:hypothetical protein
MMLPQEETRRTEFLIRALSLRLYSGLTEWRNLPDLNRYNRCNHVCRVLDARDNRSNQICCNLNLNCAGFEIGVAGVTKSTQLNSCFCWRDFVYLSIYWKEIGMADLRREEGEARGWWGTGRGDVM